VSTSSLHTHTHTHTHSLSVCVSLALSLSRSLDPRVLSLSLLRTLLTVASALSFSSTYVLHVHSSPREPTASVSHSPSKCSEAKPRGAQGGTHSRIKRKCTWPHFRRSLRDVGCFLKSCLELLTGKGAGRKVPGSKGVVNKTNVDFCGVWEWSITSWSI